MVPRNVTSKPSTMWNISYLLDCWLVISSVDSLHLWIVDAPIYLSLISLETVEKSWGVFRIYRDLPSNIQSFGSISIYVVCDIVRIKTTTLVRVTRDNDTVSERTLTRQEQDIGNITQWIRLIKVTVAVDTLAQHKGKSLPIQPLIEIFCTFWIVDLVFLLLTIYTCDCWVRPSTDFWSD